MKRVLTLLVFVALAATGLSAQAEVASTTPDGIRPVNLKQLYNQLNLDMNQLRILKSFYGDTNKDMYDQLRVTTDPAERAAIERATLVDRDQKIRSILTSEQLATYLQMMNPTVVTPDIEVGTGANDEPGGGR